MKTLKDMFYGHGAYSIGATERLIDCLQALVDVAEPANRGEDPEQDKAYDDAVALLAELQP